MHPSRALLLLVLVAGCGGTEPTNDLLGRRAHQPGAPGSVAATEPSSATEGTDEATDASGNDAGPTAATTDAGTPAPQDDAFTGAPAYAAQNGGNTEKDDHPFPGGNPAKQSCLQAQCHGPGGEGPTFLAGGTVYEDIAGTMPAAQVEVRIRDANGNARLTRTDALGNFFVQGGGGNVTFPARTGARDGAATRLMAGMIANGDCNSSTCHGGAAGVIHVP